MLYKNCVTYVCLGVGVSNNQPHLHLASGTTDKLKLLVVTQEPDINILAAMGSLACHNKFTS